MGSERSFAFAQDDSEGGGGRRMTEGLRGQEHPAKTAKKYRLFGGVRFSVLNIHFRYFDIFSIPANSADGLGINEKSRSISGAAFFAASIASETSATVPETVK